MATVRLIDEIPTKQDSHCLALNELGADVTSDDAEDDEEIAWGSDPFDILAHKESLDNND